MAARGLYCDQTGKKSARVWRYRQGACQAVGKEHAERRGSGARAMGLAIPVRYAQAHSSSLLMSEPMAIVSIVQKKN